MISRYAPEMLSLGAHTVSRMEPRQLLGMGERTARERLLPRLPIDFDRRYERRVPSDPTVRLDAIADDTEVIRSCLEGTSRQEYRERAREITDDRLTLINRTLRIAESGAVRWYDERLDELSILWPLKLYAFEPIAWIVRGFDPDDTGGSELRDAMDGWIVDWIDTVDIGGVNYLRRAWTPWSVSLRIQRWLRYLAWRDGVPGTGVDGVELAIRREIYKNALFLRNHVEWDVGGNHLIENGAALLAAGLAFGEDEWIETGIEILRRTGDQQFLDDGCHFERSAMYHVLTLTRFITSYALLDRSDRSVPEGIRATAADATGFLQYLRPPDGRIPLVNDAVYGEGLRLDACLRYADAVGISAVDPRETGVVGGTSSTPAARRSGYHWLRTDVGEMLLDGGPLGPPHLPGHAHSDTLSLLLWIGDRPVVTDTGAFDYAGGPRRNYVRGVRGHNTVQVGDVEPIPIGGSYLMGPRPKPVSRTRSGDVSLFEGSYDALPRRGPNYTHHRAAYADDDWWVVRDTVAGHGTEPVRSRLHLHPEIDPSLERDGRVRLSAAGTDVATLCPLEWTRVSVSESQYHPRFGETVERPLVELHADEGAADPTTFGVLIATKDVAGEIDVAVDGRRPGRLTVAGETHPLPALGLAPTGGN